MAEGLRLVELSLLSLEFSVVEPAEAAQQGQGEESAIDLAEDVEPAEDAATPNGESSISEGALELDGVVMRYSVGVDDSQLVLILQTTLTDVSAPYELTAITGSRFTMPDPPVPPEAAAATLVFVAYPYVRELVTNVTARSPYQAFMLPPLTRLPHPQVTGDEPPATPDK